MMKQALFGLALAGFAVFSTPAAAAEQPAPAASGVRAAVECLAHRDINAYGPLLRTPPYSAAERTEVQRLMPLLQRCRQGHEDDAFTATIVQLRGTVAQYLYARDFATAPPARTPALTAGPLLRVDQARNAAEVQPLAATYALFDCATAAHPELVRAYNATAIGSPEEQTAFRALGGALGACLTPGGSRQLAVGGQTMRGILAEMLYRWSSVQRDGPSSPFVAGAAAAPAH